MTQGRRALLALLALVRPEFVAARLGVSVAALWNWTSGRSVPGKRTVVALEAAYGIPCKSWGCRVGQPANARA